MKPKSYWSKMKQNHSTELLGNSRLKIYGKNSPPDFLDFLDFSDFSDPNAVFCGGALKVRVQ